MLNQLLSVKDLIATAGVSGLWAKVARALREGGLRHLCSKIGVAWTMSRKRPVPGEPQFDRRDYREWVRRYESLTGERKRELLRQLEELGVRPRISVLMPTYNPRREWLIQAIESVRSQIYPEWELCIADDASPHPDVRDVLEHYQRLDPRIRVAYRAVNGHISATSNSALQLARGEWVALLDHDDVLAVDALLQIARAIGSAPRARLIYSDEDKLGRNGRFGPYFKSDWNIDLFRAQNMFSHLGVLQTALTREVGGFREGLEGSQDYDLVLRCAERLQPDQVLHVPRVLYHWRVHEESTASSHDAKPYAQVAAVRALQEHFARTGVQASVVPTGVGYRAIYPLPPPGTRVAVVVALPSQAPAQDFESVVRVIERARGQVNRSVFLHGKQAPDLAGCRRVTGMTAAELGAEVQREGFQLVCVIQVPLVSAGDGWQDELARQASRPEVGLAAPLLVDALDFIVSGGVVLAPEGATGIFRGLDAHAGFPSVYTGHGGRAQLVQGLSAVRHACVMMRTDVFRRAVESGDLLHPDGGLRLSQAVREEGLTVLWTPFSKGTVDPHDIPPLGLITLRGRTDPFYNPNLFTGEADFSLAWPPCTTILAPRAAASRHDA